MEGQNAYCLTKNQFPPTTLWNWTLEKTKGSLGRKSVYFWTYGKVETKKHFILECEAFKDNRDTYVNILTTSSWVNLFSEGIVVKLGELIIKLNRKIVEIQNQQARQSIQ